MFLSKVRSAKYPMLNVTAAKTVRVQLEAVIAALREEAEVAKNTQDWERMFELNDKADELGSCL